MSDILKFLKEIDIQLDPEQIRELQSFNFTDEERERAEEFLRDLGFDLQSFCTNGNHWLIRLFGKPYDERHKVREAALLIQNTFRSPSPFNNLIKLLYGIGFSLRDINHTLYRLGFRGIPINTLQRHIADNNFEYQRERLKFMELIDSVKSSVFQEISEHVKAAERRTALIYLEQIKKLQDWLEKEGDPILEAAKFTRITKQIEALQRKINEMHGIDQLRTATIDAHKQIFIAKETKKIENEIPKMEDGKSSKGTILEADSSIVHPFQEHEMRIAS